MTTTTCASCGQALEFRPRHPGRYKLTCSSCGTEKRIVVRHKRQEREGPAHFTRVTRFRKISPLSVIYHRFESIAEHIPHDRWPILAVYGALILLGELVVIGVDPYQGMLLHGLVLLVLLVHAGALSLHSEPLSRFISALALLPLVRIVSLTIPLGTFGYLQWILLGGAVLLAAGVATARTLGMSLPALGLETPRLRQTPWIVLVLAVGLAAGVLEFMLLQPGPLVDAATPAALVGPALLVLVLTGLPEELLFRGLMQQTAEPLYGRLGAVVIPALAQGLLAFAFLDLPYVALVVATGLVFGLVAQRSKDLVGVSFAHGVANATLFVVLPVTGLPWG